MIREGIALTFGIAAMMTGSVALGDPLGIENLQDASHPKYRHLANWITPLASVDPIILGGLTALLVFAAVKIAPPPDEPENHPTQQAA